MTIKLCAASLLLIFLILTASSALNTSGTCDEIAHHIPVGCVLLSKWDFKMDTSQPPLSRYIIALPLKLFMKINIPDDKAEWRRPDRASFGRDFFYRYNNEPARILLLARIPVMIVGILCGLLVFIWARSLYGDKAGLFGLFLYCLSPNILAHAGLATTDMIAAFFILLSVYAFWLFLCDSSFRNMIFAGLCLGLAQLSKYNAVFLYPIFSVLSLFEIAAISKLKSGNLLIKLLFMFFISLIVTWGGYGFDLQPILKDTMRAEEKMDMAHSAASKLPAYLNCIRLKDVLTKTPVPLSAHMLGIAGVIRHSHEGHRSYFLGNWSSGGNPAYFLVAFLIKNPIPFLIFLSIGVFITFIRKIGRAERVILITIALFFVVSSFGKLQIGLRHILPLFPLCFIIAGRSELLFDRYKLLKLAMWLMAAWYAVTAFFVWPDYISYFNEFAGGSKSGYMYLRDSNLDWGQDLPGLAAYMKKNDVAEVALEYFGEADPASCGIRFRKLSEGEYKTPKNTIYAISVEYLDNVKWTRYHKPSATAGNSIFIYDLTKWNPK